MDNQKFDDKEIEKELKTLADFLSKKLGLPEKEVEAQIREDLESLSKPCLHNMDTVQANTIKKISEKFNLSEGKAKKLVGRIIDINSKPLLTNTHCDFDGDSDIGVGHSDQPI
jgi:hypothetical protein|tara:strand:+ start:6640 stop:6978 length:339 start_codon:yes stop_codon:yes gene_type:complete